MANITCHSVMIIMVLQRKGYISEDDLDSDLNEVLARICDDDCDNDENCEMENLFTRTSCGRTAGTWYIFSYLSRLILDT